MCLESNRRKNIAACLLSLSLIGSSAIAELGKTSKNLNVALKIEYGIGLSTIYFKDYKTIRSFAGVLNKHRQVKIDILGHTDTVGSYSVNKELSEDRAKKIKQALIKFGVAADRISSKGLGEDHPVATNSNRLGRAKNRRSIAKISALNANELKRFKDSIKGSGFLALVDNNGNFLNPEKSFQDLYQKQIASTEENSVIEVAKYQQEPEIVDEGYENVSSTYESYEEKMVDAEPKREVATEERIKLNRSSYDSETNDNKQRKNTVSGFFMPNWSSKYYGGDVGFEHGKFSPLGFGVSFKRDFNSRIYGKAHAYYLPTQVNEGTSGINFAGTSSLDYEDNIYGVSGGYAIRTREKSKLSLEASLNSHIIGGLERTSASSYKFDKYNHISLGLGLNYQRVISNKWGLDAGLHYLIPLSVSDVESASGKLWYKGSLGMNRDLSKRLKLNLKYQIIYHETEMNFSSGLKATPEFLIQTLLIGVGYKF